MSSADISPNTMPRLPARISGTLLKAQRPGMAETRPNGAKRLECAELAPAFGGAGSIESASKLVALQTLRAAGHRDVFCRSPF